MMDGKERTQRRVYVLPNELVERIVAFQQAMGLASEVEAARRLLDDALKQRDNFETITTKLIERFEELKSIREAAKDVLANHPLVSFIRFGETDLIFALKNDIEIVVDRHGKATIYDENKNILDLGFEPIPEWASISHPRKKKTSPPSYDLDDDIPF